MLYRDVAALLTIVFMILMLLRPGTFFPLVGAAAMAGGLWLAGERPTTGMVIVAGGVACLAIAVWVYVRGDQDTNTEF